MLNKEFYKDLLVEAVVENDKIALNKYTEKPVLCSKISCSYCAFDEDNNCPVSRKEWANREYAEPRIHWEDVPVDTPVYIQTADDKPNMPRHFASYDSESDIIKVFNAGRTSFTIADKHNVDQHTAEYPPSFVLFAREEDKKKYYRR